MKKIITITLALTYISGILLAGTRQALTVFIGDYPTESGWCKLFTERQNPYSQYVAQPKLRAERHNLFGERRRDIQRNHECTGGTGDQSEDRRPDLYPLQLPRTTNHRPRRRRGIDKSERQIRRGDSPLRRLHNLQLERIQGRASSNRRCIK